METNETINEVKRLYIEGFTRKKIAAKLGMDAEKVEIGRAHV